MSIEDMLKSNQPQGLELKIDKILAGVEAAIPQGKTVDVDGETLSVSDLVKQLRLYKGFFAGPRETRAALRLMISQREQASPEVVEFLSNLHAGLVGVLGRTNPALEKLGFPPRKESRPLTVEEKVRRAAKARLTRAQKAAPKKPPVTGPTA